MIKNFGIALIIVAILTLVVWAISIFVQPIIPSEINNSIIILFVALLSVVGVLAQFKDITDFVQQAIGSFSENNSNSSEQLVKSIEARMKVFYQISDSFNADETEARIDDLIMFVEKLQQGDYFSSKIKELTKRPMSLISFVGRSEEKDREETESYNLQYKEELIENSDEIISTL